MSVYILYNHITKTFKSTLTKKTTKLIVIFYKLLLPEKVNAKVVFILLHLVFPIFILI